MQDVSQTKEATVSVMESGLIVSDTYFFDRQLLHQIVYDMVSEGQDIDARNFLFACERHPTIADKAILRIRAQDLPQSAIPKKRVLNAQNGQPITVMTRIAAVARTRNDSGKIVQRRVAKEEIPEWFDQRMANNGAVVDDSSLLQINDFVIKRKGKNFHVPGALIKADVTVTDSAAFEQLLVDGVGRNKGFGFGMVEILE